MKRILYKDIFYKFFIPALSCLLLSVSVYSADVVKIGSKKFTESVILGEMIANLIESNGMKTTHLRELGGTRVLWNALLKGELDIYAEYTGTISNEILAKQKIKSYIKIKSYLNKKNILISKPLGFNNTYILGMKKKQAEELKIDKISDLINFPELKFGFSNEFINRSDGWSGLKKHYNLNHNNVIGLDHDIAYRGLESNSIDLIDLYSTDAEIKHYDIKRIKDDLNFFPKYEAVILYRKDLLKKFPGISEFLQLEGRINEDEMTKMNARVKLDKISETQVVSEFLKDKFNISINSKADSFFSRLYKNTFEHLILVFISLTAAILLSIPLGIIAAKFLKTGHIILGVSGILQTIPSLALLVFMIPLFGIGKPPAIIALFLYSLLPIIRNTYTGLVNIPNSINESAIALGLPERSILFLIQLPLASRTILAGVKTSAVINIGTATLGALIGAGGYGQPILTGIRLDDIGLILEGAVPAAILAILVQSFFNIMDKILIPKGLRIKDAKRVE